MCLVRDDEHDKGPDVIKRRAPIDYSEGVAMNGNTQPDDSITPQSGSLAHDRARLDDLESRIAYQEHWLESLDKAVAAQERRLAQLERMSELMGQRLREQHQAINATSEDSDYRAENEVPPHY